MEAKSLILKARGQAGMTQRELARRAGTSAAAICKYESGAQIPRFDTLCRIIEAAGASLVCEIRGPQPGAIDLARNARVLEDVLELAGHLPGGARRDLEAPPFASMARPD